MSAGHHFRNASASSPAGTGTRARPVDNETRARSSRDAKKTTSDDKMRAVRKEITHSKHSREDLHHFAKMDGGLNW